MNTLLLIVGLLCFLGLVVVHEFGHFIMARRHGVAVEEFGIGFPPRVWGRKTRGGWVFSINLLPLGGFVKLKGEHDTDTERGSFGAASIGAKANIMLAGVTMNLLTAYVLLAGLALVGMPQLVDHQFVIKSDVVYVQRATDYVATDVVEKGSPAAQAGMHQGDALVALGDAAHLSVLHSADALPALVRRYAGQTVSLEYRVGGADGRLVTKTVTVRTAATVAKAAAAGKQIGYLGVTVYDAQTGVTVARSTWSAPIVAAGLIKQFTVLTFQGLGKALAGLGSIVAGGVTGNTAARQAGQAEASSQVAGPVGIFFIFKYGAALGVRFIVLIVALLSLTLAVMNVLPIPALDGGRLWLLLITRALKKPLSPGREEAINAAGFALLMGLVILVTIADVRRFF